MTIENASDIKTLWSERMPFYAGVHNEIDTLVRVYEGILPPPFNDFFHEEMHLHIINMIRLAWDDLATLAGKEFPISVEGENDSATALQRAQKIERVGYGYNRAGRNAGGVTMKSLMKILMWWLVGTANAVGMTLPDYENHSPYFTFRDPRTHYPPVGWSPWNETRADDALFAYQKTVAQLKAEFPDRVGEIGSKTGITYHLGAPGSRSSKTDDDDRWVWVGEYYRDETWMTVTLEDQAVTLLRSDDGDRDHPGIQPVWAMSLYSGVNTKGRSLFADQVSIQAAMARMFSQKLDFFDRTLYPLIFTTPLAGKTVRVGPYAVNEFDISLGVSPRMDTVAPAHTIDADQTMGFAVGMSRMLNRNPESMQGAGEANSAKALSELKDAVVQTIQDLIWPNAIEVLPSAYTGAAKMDIRLWGTEMKKATGRQANKNFHVSYRPRDLLAGREHRFEVNPGLGLGGYQGTLELMQLYGAKMISLDDVLERMAGIDDSQEAKRKIQGDQVAELVFADLAAKAQAGALMPGALSEARKRVLSDAEDLFDVLSEMEKAGRLMAPPPPQLGAPGAEGTPGAPGTGSPASFLPLPTLEALRGGPGSV
jgi:hypothetical protein